MGNRLLRTVAGVSVVAMVAVGCSGSGDGDGQDGGRSGTPDVVTTSSGPVRGSAVDNGVTEFLGIPYAAPPVGDLRWRPPQPPESWSDVRDSRAPGPPCLQGGANDGGLGQRSDEACLTLNVYRPPAGSGTAGSGTARSGTAGSAGGESDGGLPVMFWVHGGGFVSGSAVDVDPAAFAAGGPVLVVSADYRLSPLGYMAHPAFAAESDGQTGAYAIQDLTAALRWVRDNAKAFGGDPGRVTIFGQSAGSINVCALLASPPAAGLFHRAITQSGPCTWPFPSIDTALSVGTGVATRLHCPEGSGAAVAACLRSRPGRDVIFVAGGAKNVLDPIPWTPAIGTAIEPLSVPDAIRQGKVPPVPVMVGGVRDEGRGFTTDWLGTGPIDDARYVQIVKQYFPDRADAVLATYPPGSAQPRELLARVITDAVFACAANATAQLFAASGVPVYSYEFDIPNQAPITDGVAAGPTHGYDLGYLFPRIGQRFPPERRELSEAMIGYWTRFAATGDPNDPTGAAPEWPTWGDGGNHQKLGLVAGDISVTDDGETAHHCDMWR